jgi:hypothetical protein
VDFPADDAIPPNDSLLLSGAETEWSPVWSLREGRREHGLAGAGKTADGDEFWRRRTSVFVGRRAQNRGHRARPADSLSQREGSAAACEAKSKEQNWKMNISVVDDANEIFFEKMDGAYLGSRDIAHHNVGAIPLPDPFRTRTCLRQGSQRSCRASPRSGNHRVCRRTADHDRGQSPRRGIGVSGGMCAGRP